MTNRAKEEGSTICLPAMKKMGRVEEVLTPPKKMKRVGEFSKCKTCPHNL